MLRPPPLEARLPPLPQILAALALLGACYVLFGALGRAFPCNPDRPVFVSKAIGLDLGYAALGVLYAGIVPAAAALAAHVPGVRAFASQAWIGHMPVWAQLALLLTATDFAQYWADICELPISLITAMIKHAQRQGFCPGDDPHLTAVALVSMLNQFCYTQLSGADAAADRA